MPKSEEEYRKIRKAQRENILNAAKAAVLRIGWSATMADIAAEAKISQGLAYRYFDSKEAIFAELFKQMLDHFLNLKEDNEDKISPTQRLKSIISRMLSGTDFLGNFEIAVRTSYEKASMHSLADCMRSGDIDVKKIIGMIKDQLLAMHNLICEIITEGQKTGEFIQEEPEKLTFIILTTVRGLTSFSIHHPDQFRLYFPYTDTIMRIVSNPEYKQIQ